MFPSPIAATYSRAVSTVKWDSYLTDRFNSNEACDDNSCLRGDNQTMGRCTVSLRSIDLRVCCCSNVWYQSTRWVVWKHFKKKIYSPGSQIPTSRTSNQSDDGCGRFHLTIQPPFPSILSLSLPHSTEHQLWRFHDASWCDLLRWVVQVFNVLIIRVGSWCSNFRSSLLRLSPYWNTLCPCLKVLSDIVYCARTKEMSVYTSALPHPYGVLPTGKLPFILISAVVGSIWRKRLLLLSQDIETFIVITDEVCQS